MNYHNIKTDDMNNGPGLRVTLFVAGCSHHCKGCHNKETWDPNSGIPFDEDAKKEIMSSLSKDYISGITLSGGDPLFIENAREIAYLVSDIVDEFGDKKSIMLYTGFTITELMMYACEYMWENAVLYTPEELEDKWKYRPEIRENRLVQYWMLRFKLENEDSNYLLIYKWLYYVTFILVNIDAIVDGKFDENLADVNYKWAGSTNQNVILDFDFQKYLTYKNIIHGCSEVTPN